MAMATGSALVLLLLTAHALLATEGARKKVEMVKGATVAATFAHHGTFFGLGMVAYLEQPANLTLVSEAVDEIVQDYLPSSILRVVTYDAQGVKRGEEQHMGIDNLKKAFKEIIWKFRHLGPLFPPWVEEAERQVFYVWNDTQANVSIGTDSFRFQEFSADGDGETATKMFITRQDITVVERGESGPAVANLEQVQSGPAQALWSKYASAYVKGATTLLSERQALDDLMDVFADDAALRSVSKRVEGVVVLHEEFGKPKTYYEALFREFGAVHATPSDLSTSVLVVDEEALQVFKISQCLKTGSVMRSEVFFLAEKVDGGLKIRSQNVVEWAPRLGKPEKFTTSAGMVRSAVGRMASWLQRGDAVATQQQQKQTHHWEARTREFVRWLQVKGGCQTHEEPVPLSETLPRATTGGALGLRDGLGAKLEGTRLRAMLVGLLGQGAESTTGQEAE